MDYPLWHGSIPMGSLSIPRRVSRPASPAAYPASSG